MEVSAWKNRKLGSGSASFALSMSNKDRNDYINREWKTVILHLDGHPNPVEANIDKFSFWKTCPHFISTEIKAWLTKNKYIPWEKGKPPKFFMSQIQDSNHFIVQKK